MKLLSNYYWYETELPNHLWKRTQPYRNLRRRQYVTNPFVEQDGGTA